MKRILAVSGGIDSMAMLDFLLEKYPKEELVVASFDHKTRPSSAKDVEFVSEVSSALKIPFYRGEFANGGKKTLSEAEAREARYRFLFRVAFLEKGEVYVAHHLDDLIESITINFLRGTGFRGLAVMARPGIVRPFLEQANSWDKRAVLGYAAKKKIVFREDPTNSSDDYLRNRIRRQVRELPRGNKEEIYQLWLRQKETIREIEQICESILPEDLRVSRKMLKKSGKEAGIEILREGLKRRGLSATRVQLGEFYDATLNYAPGKKFNLPGDRLVKISRNFVEL